MDKSTFFKLSNDYYMRVDHGFIECYWLDKTGFHAVAHKMSAPVKALLVTACSFNDFYYFLKNNFKTKEQVCLQ